MKDEDRVRVKDFIRRNITDIVYAKDDSEEAEEFRTEISEERVEVEERVLKLAEAYDSYASYALTILSRAAKLGVFAKYLEDLEAPIRKLPSIHPDLETMARAPLVDVENLRRMYLDFRINGEDNKSKKPDQDIDGNR